MSIEIGHPVNLLIIYWVRFVDFIALKLQGTDINVSVW